MMKKNMLFRKGLVCAILVLFVSISTMSLAGSLSMEKQATQESLPFAYSTVGASGISLITVKVVAGEMGLNDWYVDDICVNFTKSDDIAEIKYQVDYEAVQTYTEPFYITTDSTNHQLRWSALEYEGNYSGFEGPFYFKMDQTDPAIEFILDDWSGDKPPYLLTFTATATDATSGIERVEFYINHELKETVYGPGPEYVWEIYWVPIPYTVFRAIAYDMAGNSAYDDLFYTSNIAVLESPIFSTDIVEEQDSHQISQGIVPKTEIVWIEKELYGEKPKSDCSMDDAFDVASLVVVMNRKMRNNNWVDGDFKITMIPDPYDIKDVYYKLNDADWMRYTEPLVISEDGFHTFWWYIVDNEGDISTPDFISFNIDLTPPEINLIRERLAIDKVKFTADVYDETSGIDRVEFSWDYIDYDFPYEWIYYGFGNVKVKATVYDKAGNSNSSSLSTWRSKSNQQSSSLPSSQKIMSVIPLTGIDSVKKSTKATLNGKTLYVGGSGPENYTKIQDAIDNASDGDTVFVFDDSSPYYETVRVNKRINLIGENRNTTIINDGVSPETVLLTHSNVLICNFTLTGGYSGISVVYADNCIIQGNKIVFNYYGIEIYWDAINNIITDNFIMHNDLIGIFDECRGSTNTVKYNIIGSNGNPNYYGWGGIYKHRDGGYYHHNDIDLNWWNAYTEYSYWGVWDDGSEGNYWGDWEKNPGYPNVYIIRGTVVDQMDNHPSATPYFNYPIVYIYNDYTAEPGETIHFWPRINKPSSSVSWFWDFGDGNTSNEEDPKHSYSKSGIYHINVTVTDDQGISDTDRSIAYIGRPPNTPTISGPTKGKTFVSYNYSIVATDPDGGYLYYDIYWGTGMSDYYYGPYPAGEVVNISWEWRTAGKYTIYIKAVDETGFESDEATLEVNISRKSKDINLNTLKLVEKFPLLERLLNTR